MDDRAAAIEMICAALTDRAAARAEILAGEVYPFEPIVAVLRRANIAMALRVFSRDGFIDRYSGARLIFPGVLRILSITMPTAFPFQVNWKMSETHQAYWELMPTLDHVVPVTKGGQDEFENLVTTSMLLNARKANWTLEELGWMLHKPPRSPTWDGLAGWFIAYVERESGLLDDPYIKRWYRTAKPKP